MAFYPPPTELLPIFNPSDYEQQGNTTTSDIPFLTGYFVRYPVSQGSETIAGTLVVQGQITADTNIVMTGTPATNYIQFPDGTKQYTAGGATPNLSSVLAAGNSAGSNSINMNNNAISAITTATMNSLQINQTNTPIIYDKSSGIYTNAFISADYTNGNFTLGTNTQPFPTSGTAQSNFALGVQALNSALNAGSASLDNVAIGNQALATVTTGQGNTAVGTAVLGGVLGSNNTSIGNNSGAFLTGSAHDNVFVGNSAGNNGNTTNITTGSANTVIGSQTTLGTSSAQSTLIGFGAASSSNTTSNEIVLGTATETVVVRNKISFPNNNGSYITTGPYYNQITFSTNNTTYATGTAALDTNLFLNPTTTGLSFTIPTPVGNQNKTIVIANESGNVFNLLNNNSSNFIGDYGTQTPTLDVPDNTNMYLFSDGTNWQVWDRTGNYSYTLTATASSYSFLTSYNLCNSYFRIGAGSTITSTITLPTPTDTQCHNTYIIITNLSQTYPQTLRLNSGSFTAKYGTGNATFSIPPLSQIQIFSNGTNWQVVNTGSQPLQVPQAISTATDLSGGGLYANCNLVITSTGANTVTIPAPNGPNGSNGVLRVDNATASNAAITLSIGSGLFAGIYGSGSTTLVVPQGAFVYMTSNGTNWNVSERTPGIYSSISFSTSSTTYSTNTSILDTTLLLTATVPSLSFTIPTPVGYGNRTLTITNVGTTSITLLNANSSNWIGNYGSNGTSSILPENITVFLYSDGTNWNIWNRSGSYAYNLAVQAATYTFFSDYTICNSILRFTSTSNQSATITLPPAQNAACHDTFIQIENQSATYSQTITDPSSTFGGKYGTGTTTFLIPPQSQVRLFTSSNSASWNITNTSQPLLIPLSISTNTDLSAGGLYANCNLTITSTSGINNTITLPTPSTSQGSNGILRFENSYASTSYITLTIGAGNFTGIYGSGTANLIVPVNSWLRMYSDGTNWICSERGDYGWQYYYYISTSSTSLPVPGQYFRTYVAGVSNTTGYTISFAGWSVPTAQQEGLSIMVRRAGGYGATTFSAIATPGTTTNNTTFMIYGQATAPPCTGAALISTNTLADQQFRCCQVGFSGTGGTINAATTIGSSLVSLNGLASGGSIGNVVYGSQITLAGNNYTITGYNTWSGWGTGISGTAGTNTNTNSFTVTGVLTVGSVFQVSGVNYTITDINSSANISSSTFNMVVGVGGIIFTPAIPVGGWTLVLPTNPCTGNSGNNNGIYSVTPAFSSVIGSGTAFTITNNVFAWCLM